MNRFRTWSLMLTLLLVVTGWAGTAVAQPAPDEDGDPAMEGLEGSPDEGGPRGMMRELVQLHLRLGRYYLMDGQLDQARAHFLAVAEPDLVALGLDEDAEANGPRVLLARRGGYLMAAVSTYLMGDEEGAIALAQTGQSLPVPEPPRHMRREARRERGDCAGEGDCRGSGEGPGPAMGPGQGQGHGRGHRGGSGPDGRVDPFEQFLSNPQEFVQRFANGSAGLEERILEIQTELSDNE